MYKKLVLFGTAIILAVISLSFFYYGAVKQNNYLLGRIESLQQNQYHNDKLRIAIPTLVTLQKHGYDMNDTTEGF